VLHSKVGYWLSHKHWTKLERPTRDKDTNLSRKFVNYGQKSYIALSPGPNVINLFTDVIYEFFVISWSVPL
jgi:hypothetical protein